ncbi:glycosyltransferase family 4 protein [Paenarthrobacter ureafaciens]|uniref:glycosyltransferase family 4 protein n=1 Tax=Paenarthrobacter ureafaciens TaxID=37931 RepID=UPI00242018B3|nr:glycosyltransferase family 4 protein [Paenarthrobacter ureafaciens]
MPNGHRIVLMPARIDPRKDQETMLRAFAALRESLPDVSLVIAGRRTDSNYAAKISRLLDKGGLGADVVIAERISDSEMEVLYQESALTVMCSLQEGLGLAAVEAMSWGSPVVTTDVDGLREVVHHEENGLLVPPRNPSALAGAILRLMTDSELMAKVRANARQTVRDKFDEEMMVSKTLKVYHDVIARQNHASGVGAGS